MNQETLQALKKRISKLNKKNSKLNKEVANMQLEMEKINDPQALIPKEYSTIEEYLVSVPKEVAIMPMLFSNKKVAEKVQELYNEYKNDYHIVPCHITKNNYGRNNKR